MTQISSQKKVALALTLGLGSFFQSGLIADQDDSSYKEINDEGGDQSALEKRKKALKEDINFEFCPTLNWRAYNGEEISYKNNLFRDSSLHGKFSLSKVYAENYLLGLEVEVKGKAGDRYGLFDCQKWGGLSRLDFDLTFVDEAGNTYGGGIEVKQKKNPYKDGDRFLRFSRNSMSSFKEALEVFNYKEYDILLNLHADYDPVKFESTLNVPGTKDRRQPMGKMKIEGRVATHCYVGLKLKNKPNKVDIATSHSDDLDAASTISDTVYNRCLEEALTLSYKPKEHEYGVKEVSFCFSDFSLADTFCNRCEEDFGYNCNLNADNDEEMGDNVLKKILNNTYKLELKTEHKDVELINGILEEAKIEGNLALYSKKTTRGDLGGSEIYTRRALTKMGLDLGVKVTAKITPLSGDKVTTSFILGFDGTGLFDGEKKKYVKESKLDIFAGVKVELDLKKFFSGN